MSFTWWEGAPENRDTPERTNFSLLSLENTLKSLQLDRVARLLLAKGILLGELAFCHVNSSSASRGEKTVKAAFYSRVPFDISVPLVSSMSRV